MSSRGTSTATGIWSCRSRRCSPSTSSDAQKRGTRATLATVLEAYLRLLHPLMPFITEEIWQAVAPMAGRKGETIMLQSYPTAAEFPRDAAAEAAITPIKAVILGARQIRGQLDIPQSREIAVAFQSPEATDEASTHRRASMWSRGVGKIGELKILAERRLAAAVRNGHRRPRAPSRRRWRA